MAAGRMTTEKATDRMTTERATDRMTTSRMAFGIELTGAMSIN